MLTFGGKPSVTIAPGEELWSDPATLDVPQHADVAISIFLPDQNYKPTATHGTGLKTSYLSYTGDETSEGRPSVRYVAAFSGCAINDRSAR